MLHEAMAFVAVFTVATGFLVSLIVGFIFGHDKSNDSTMFKLLLVCVAIILLVKDTSLVIMLPSLASGYAGYSVYVFLNEKVELPCLKKIVLKLRSWL